ncbi:hypothetical protein EYZ11_001423 [Aspergillus tanneri]|uniref:RING-type domain-containing protein n=1 Tax=Aspergillus tanneri TaxID=1220188 RepID=A0A4S3JUM6_9EURO|nr:hypothetical protein EYZ11_001423 [Aspergillus tanneri]
MNTPSSEALPSSQNTRSVSPPPQYSSQEPYRNPRPNNRSLARTRQISVSTGDNIRYGATSNAMLGEGTNCWSDEFTASAVLSLLHREPLSPLPCPVTYNPISARNTSLLTCTVCFETFRDDFFPDAPIAAGCDHASMPGTHICLGCLRRSLDVQLSSSDTNQLECPLCHEQLSDEEVHRWASRRTFQAYDRRRTWQVLEEDAEFIMCIRSDCGYGQLHAGGLEDPIVTPWHEGLTCAQYEDMINPRVSNDSIEAYPENTPDRAHADTDNRGADLALSSLQCPHGKVGETHPMRRMSA